jgi:enoyl-CoA hydratase
MAGDVILTIEGSIGFLRLHNPERRNAISRSMWEKIATFARSRSEREGLRVIVVSGEGGLAFSAGADVSEFETGRSDTASATAYDDLVEETCRSVEEIEQTTIGLIKGACIGAGASLAASCDLRVASGDAFFSVPAARLGLGYDPRGIRRFCRVFGENLTRFALFSAQKIPAARAYQLGAVHALAALEEVDTVATQLASSIANNAPLTIKAAKYAIRSLAGNDAETRSEVARLYAQADASADYIEGRTAFFEKRPAKFLGR